jgi:hypothetical protein
MLLNILLATKAILILNGGFVENPNLAPYDTLEIRDENFNAYTYISETNCYEIIGDTYRLIPWNTDTIDYSEITLDPISFVETPVITRDRDDRLYVWIEEDGSANLEYSEPSEHHTKPIEVIALILIIALLVLLVITQYRRIK